MAWFVPAPLRKSFAPLLSAVAARRSSADAARKAVAAWLWPDALPHAYFFTRALFPVGAELTRLMEPRFRPSSVAADGVTLEPTWVGWMERAADGARNFEGMGSVSWLEMRSYMASTLLRDTDAVSMARSLEVRVPLLDTPVVEFVGALPDASRRRNSTGKGLLIEAIGDLLPREVLAQKKRTFTLPWEQWLRGPLREQLETSFAAIAPGLAAFVHARGVREVWNAFLAGKTSWSRPWSIYVVNEWCRRNL
jgi:asparagine synthase (glutamine-hydrolysing)